MLRHAITLDRITKRFDEHVAVDNLSITVGKGEFLSLLGASGSGKSTTLAMIAGFEMPDAGEVLFYDRNVTRLPSCDRGLGMVFQNYALFPHLNVFENVAFPLRVRRRPARDIADRVADALGVVRLQGMERRYPRQLSGGQQQRVALARAIVAQPEIVLMDEPLGALDKGLRYQMQTEIADIHRRLGMTVVFVTHDQEEAMNLSDRIAIMKNGQIVQAGPPRDVYERPDDTFVARFLGESNLIEGIATGNSIQTSDGQMSAANTGDGRASLFVRPEKLILHQASVDRLDNRNVVQGRVSRVSFLGNLVRVELITKSERMLTIDMTNGSGVHLPKPEENVSASWAVEDSRLLVN